MNIKNNNLIYRLNSFNRIIMTIILLEPNLIFSENQSIKDQITNDKLDFLSKQHISIIIYKTIISF